MKQFIFFVAVALALALTGISSGAGVGAVSQAPVITAPDGMVVFIPEFRDINPAKAYDCWGCPHDPSMDKDANGKTVVRRVREQSDRYKKYHAAYQSGWRLDDVKKASENAFTSVVAAWPWNNLGYHIFTTEGPKGYGRALGYYNIALLVLSMAPATDKAVKGCKEIIMKNIDAIQNYKPPKHKAIRKQSKV